MLIFYPRHWSLGANISYLFGNIVLSELQSDLVVEKGCMRDRFMPIWGFSIIVH